MATSLAQTPGVWALKPGDDNYDAACDLALKACGIDPGSFGSYDTRAEAQRAARATSAGQATSSTNLEGEDLQTFVTANSESGHMAQNSIFQYSYSRTSSSGKRRRDREDPCMNVPPRSGAAGAPSSYGYTCAGAPATDHFGRSSMRGSCHGEISGSVEKQWQGNPGDALGQGSIEDQVRASARCHTDANRDRSSAKASRRGQVRDQANAQQRNADRMLAGDPDAAELGAASPTAEGQPAGPSGPGPSDAVKNFAAECEVNKWKKKMAEMRANAINNSAMGQAASAANGGTPFTELTPQQQQDFVNNNPQFFGQPPPAPPAGSNMPQPPAPPQPSGSGRTPPTDGPSRQDCLNYQGNYLAWQTANNGGTPPGWAGAVPGGGPVATPGTGSFGGGAGAGAM